MRSRPAIPPGPYLVVGLARSGIGAAARELEAFGLEPAPDLGRIAQRGTADGAVGLQDAVRLRHRFAQEALVQRAGVAVVAAAGERDVAVAHPAAGRDAGHDRPQLL